MRGRVLLEFALLLSVSALAGYGLLYVYVTYMPAESLEQILMMNVGILR